MTQSAELGDPAAKQIVQNLAKELAISVEAVNSDLDIEKPIEIGCTGGLFSSDIVLESVDEQIKRRIPCSNLLPPIMNPVVGGIAVGISDSKICITRNKLRELDSRLGKNT